MHWKLQRVKNVWSRVLAVHEESRKLAPHQAGRKRETSGASRWADGQPNTICVLFVVDCDKKSSRSHEQWLVIQ